MSLHVTRTRALIHSRPGRIFACSLKESCEMSMVLRE